MCFGFIKEITVQNTLIFCSDILADIAWNEQFWIPFKEKNTVNSETYNGSQMHQDCFEIDTILYHNFIHREQIWSILNKSSGVELPDIVSNNAYSYSAINFEQVSKFIVYQSEKILKQLVRSE